MLTGEAPSRKTASADVGEKSRIRTPWRFAKENGRNGFSYYHEELSSKATRRIEIQTAVRRSLQDHEFGMIPADERFRFNDPALVEIDNWLKYQ